MRHAMKGAVYIHFLCVLKGRLVNVRGRMLKTIPVC